MTKLVLPVLFISAGSFAIIGSVVAASVVSLLGGFIWLGTVFLYRTRVHIDTNIIRKISGFAAGNYIGGIFGILPATLVPLIIISSLGSAEAAFYYMPLMMVSFLNIIPSASAQSLFAEVSHDEAGLAHHLIKSLRYLLLIMLPASVVIFLLGPFVLGIFGPLYASHGTLPLELLTLASIVGSLNYFGDTLLNIKKYSRLYIFMNALNAIAIIALVFVSAPYGLAAIALSNLAGQSITLLVYVGINWRLIQELFAGTAPKIPTVAPETL